MNKKTFNRLLSYVFRKYKLLAFFTIIFFIFSSTVPILGVTFIGMLIDDYITPLIGSSAPDFRPLIGALSILAGLYLLDVLINFLAQFLTIKLAHSVSKDIRDEVFEHMQTLPIKYFDTHEHGDIMSIYSNDIDTVLTFFSQCTRTLITAAFTMINILIAMIFLNIPLMVIVLISVVLIRLVTKFLITKSSAYYRLQQNNLGKVNGFVEEMISGQKVVKVFNHEQESVEKFNELNEELFKSASKAGIIVNTLIPLINNLCHLTYVVVAIVGSLFLINGKFGITVGIIASFLQLSRSFSSPIIQITQQMNLVVAALAGGTRIFKLLDTEPEVDNGSVSLYKKDGDDWVWKTKDNKEVPLKGHVVLENINFGYNDDTLVLKNLSVHANPGEKVAFVGATGSGKTTITNLINRFYEVSDGKILFDGINTKDIKKSSLRSSLGIVLQDTNLFSGTIMNNIRYGKLDATDDEVIAAAKLANAHDFITRLEHGYDTELNELSSNLSQGQRQLISIARAAISNPPVLILDEATSSIDTHTEKLVQDGMDKLMHGRTVFVIAHRLSTIKNADAIIVLDHGEIIERGPHKSLIKAEGIYYQLYTGAFELK